MAFPPSILIIIPLLFLLTKSFSDPRSATEPALVCSNRTAEPANRRAYVANYVAAMESVRAQVSMNGSGAAINGTGSTKIYALADCMRDLSRNDCLLCVELCKVHIHLCMPFQTLVLGGRIYFDGCFLRFDSYRFFGESEGFNDGVICGRKEFGGNRTLFSKSVGDLVRDLKVGGVKNNGFFAGSVGRGEFRVYGLVQCWRFVRGLNCERCLGELVGKIGDCLGKEDVRVLNSGCYLRYSTQKFYHDSRRDSARRRNRGDKLSAIVLAGASAGIAIVLLVATVTFFLRKQIVKQKREKEQLDFLATVTKSKLIFSYETLEKATKYFHDSHKIGEGGSGHVYRGKLPDGRTVAVKRILFDTKQWVEHFFNEVNLISNIDHKNHVKLLGYSITGPESLLVYEYMPNQSLHHYFFAKKNAKPLIWEVRYKIIVGAAEGLAYLHEESNLRIIHRDIKLSNILLDEDFNAKIADFGLARLFPEDKTHLSSAIAGTLGYMAPEYVFRGQLTEKADIYSFGVLIIEVVSGRRNNAFSDNTCPLLQMVWNLYQKGKLCEAVDPLLEGNFQEEAVLRLLLIGLLCAQASAELRPAMSKVVKMLINHHDLPKPTQPPFLNSSYAE